MDAAAGNMANFTGVLVQRQYRPGQQYVQLVFQTAKGRCLSLSRNMTMIRSLVIGDMYHVTGPAYAVGGKLYVQEPTAIFLKSGVGPTKHRTRVFAVGTALALTVAIASATFFATRSPTNTKRLETKGINIVNVSREQLAQSSSNPNLSAPAQPAATPPGPKATRTTKVAKAPVTKTAAQPVVTVAAASQSSVQPPVTANLVQDTPPPAVTQTPPADIPTPPITPPSADTTPPAPDPAASQTPPANPAPADPAPATP